MIFTNFSNITRDTNIVPRDGNILRLRALLLNTPKFILTHLQVHESQASTQSRLKSLLSLTEFSTFACSPNPRLLKPKPQFVSILSFPRPTMSTQADFVDSWTEQEEDIVIQWHHKAGCNWNDIRERLPGRSAEDCKNYWKLKGKWRNM